MQLEDVGSENLRKAVEEDPITNNLIEQFIYSRSRSSSLKEANKYLDQLRDAVRI